MSARRIRYRTARARSVEQTMPGTETIEIEGLEILPDKWPAEVDLIISALEACNWNRVQAAKLSGIPRRTFYRRLREYGIQ